MSKLIHGVNDLYTWCYKNKKRGQEILDEFTGIDENDKYINIHNITYGSKKKLKWRCRICNNFYIAAVYSRTSGNTDCKTCKNKIGAQKRNKKKIVDQGVSLFDWCNKNGQYGNMLISEWQGLKSNGDTIDIHEVAYGSAVSVIWKCIVNPNHIWQTKIYSRTGRPRLCPFCSGKKVDIGKNDLYTWALANNKNLIEEWVGLDTNGNKIDINNISYSTHKKVKWQCKINKEHIWDATVNSRTNQSIGCPYCNKSGTSFTEQILYFYYNTLYPDTISRGKFQGYEFDVAIPELKACIEYNGLWWHFQDDAILRDKAKYDICIQHNVKLIVILEDDERYFIDKGNLHYDFIINRKYKRKDTEIYDLIFNINKELHILDNNIQHNIELAIKKATNFLGMGDNKNE